MNESPIKDVLEEIVSLESLRAAAERLAPSDIERHNQRYREIFGEDAVHHKLTHLPNAIQAAIEKVEQQRLLSQSSE